MRIHLLCGLFAGCLIASPALAAEPLWLDEAARLALSRDPGVARLEALAGALRAQAVADAQLPDPKLKLGAQSLPTDSFALDQEAMTQLQLGLVQEFPRGDTRALRGRQGETLAGAEAARANEQRLRVLRSVREAWLEAWYQQQALAVLEQNRELFRRLVSITEAQYAAGRDAQQAVLSARVEQGLLEDRIARVETAAATARAELGRWVGAAAQRPLPPGMPEPSDPPALERLVAGLTEHPAIRAEQARAAAGELEVALARQAYRPAWALDLTYGKRFGEDAAGNGRPDLLSAMVTMELPLFTGQRQDRRVAAARQRADAAQLGHDERLRDLEAALAAAWAEWQRLNQRLTGYRNDILPDAAQNTRAATKAYQSRTAEFTTLVRAHLAELESRLQALRIETDRARARAALTWFAGERS